MYLIRHKQNETERRVTAEQWAIIEGNEATKGVYSLISKNAGDGKADIPEEVIPEEYAGKTVEELQALLTSRNIEFPANAKEKKLIKLLMDADKLK